jgi:hypothetical protein
MTTLTSRLTALGLAALAFTTACGSDNLLEPTFGAGCLKGSISPGQSIDGSLSSASCRMTYHFYVDDVIPYESYAVHLDAGKAYMFYEQQIPDPDQDGLNEVDATLTLWGKDDQGRSVPLAVSDDEAGGVDGHDSEFFFVAPRSGDFVLVAGAYDWEDFGGYRLSMRSCPVLGVVDTAGTYEFTSPSSSCVRHDNTTAGVPMTYSFLSVKADSFETVSVSIAHSASTAYYELFGPDFDTYANIYAESDASDSYADNSADVTMSEIPGLVTIGVGTSDFDAGGTYTVTLGRAFFAPPAPAQTPWLDGRLTLKAPHGKKAR